MNIPLIDSWMAVSILLFIVCTGLVLIWDYRCRQVNELREENKILRGIRKKK